MWPQDGPLTGGSTVSNCNVITFTSQDPHFNLPDPNLHGRIGLEGVVSLQKAN